MGIMDIFRGGSGASQNPAGNSGTPAQQPSNNPANPATNPTVPSSATPTSDGSHPAFPVVDPAKSPLDGYSTLWNKADTDKQMPTGAVPLSIDPNKIMEASRGIDFTKAVDPAIMQKAMSGDAEAFAKTMNSIAQHSFAQAVQTNSAIVDRALQEQAAKFQNEVIPEILRRHEVSTGLRSESNILDNPAVAPMAKMVENQFLTKYPNASPAEVREHVKGYLSTFAESFVSANGGTVTRSTAGANPNPSSQPTFGRKEETDWLATFAPELNGRNI